MKNNINQRVIAASLGHASSIITVDVYTDEDIRILKEKYGRDVQEVRCRLWEKSVQLMHALFLN